MLLQAKVEVKQEGGGGAGGGGTLNSTVASIPSVKQVNGEVSKQGQSLTAKCAI